MLDLTELLADARTIWPEKMSDQEIVVAMMVTVGDVARQVRDAHEGGVDTRAELAREMGNLVLSTLRWMDDLGLDPMGCLAAAFRSQRSYQARRVLPHPRHGPGTTCAHCVAEGRPCWIHER